MPIFVIKLKVNCFPLDEVGIPVILTVKFADGFDAEKKTLPDAKLSVYTLLAGVTDTTFSVNTVEVIKADGVSVVHANVPTVIFDEPVKVV